MTRGFFMPRPVPALPGELFDNLDLSCGGSSPARCSPGP